MTARKEAVLLKCILLGDPAVGKTSVFHRFLKNEFSETYKATIGADFYSKDIRIDDTEVILQMWDTAGQERYQSLGTSFYRGSDVCILIYDITVQQSFDALTKYVEQFINGAATTDDPQESNFIFVVLGNKGDLVQDSQAQGLTLVSNEEAESFCQEHGFKFFETSAKSGWQINEAFEYVAKKGLEISDSRPNEYDMVAFDLDDYEADEPIQKSGICC